MTMFASTPFTIFPLYCSWFGQARAFSRVTVA